MAYDDRMTDEAEPDSGYRHDPWDEELPRRRPYAMIAAIVLMVLFGFAVWYAYDYATTPGVAVPPPLIRAEPGPTKVAPQDPGGLQVPNQDKQIYERLGQAAPPAVPERLLPPPEQPRPEPRPEVAQVPEPPAAAFPAPASPPVASPPAGTIVAAPPPAAATPVPEKGAKPTVAPPPPAARMPNLSAAPAAGAPRIQLGAFKDTGAAEQSWQRLQRGNNDVLGPLTPSVLKADLGEKGIMQRLQAGPFPSRGAAEAACEKLKARKLGCIVVAP